MIISPYALFVEAIEQILRGEGIEVAATARDLESALPLVQAHRPDTIIVDADGRYTPDQKVLDLLVAGHEGSQLIFFTLNSNRMVVHERRQVGQATPADLISALRHGSLPDYGNNDAALAS